MDHALLINAGIDCKVGIGRCMGNEALYSRLLSRMLDDTNVPRTRAFLAEQDYEGAYARLHELKGVSGNLGMDRVFEISSAMLRLMRENDYENLSQHIDDLEIAFNDAIVAIRAAL